MALSALTATWAARHTARVGLDHPDRMTAVIAALLMQDAGELLADRYRKRSDPGTGSRRSDPNHPAVAAAILGQFPECSSRIPILVGGHHERLDGTGFPQRLAGRKLSPELRWITLLVRLGELILDPLTDEMTTGGQGCDRAQVAGVRLWREVRRGAFEERQARLLLDGLRPGLADQIEELFPRFQKRIVDPRHLVPAPAGTWSREAAVGMAGRGEFMEAAHEIAAPAYLRRRRVIDPRAAKGAAPHRSGSPSG